MDSKKKKELELWAAKIRKTALQTIQTAGSGHIGGSFSSVILCQYCILTK